MIQEIIKWFKENKERIVSILNLILILIGIVGLVYLYRIELVKGLMEITKVDDDEIYGQNTEIIETYFVDISGEVIVPGVYEIKRGAIMADIVNEAGGFTENVDQEYLYKCINMAETLNNEQKIYLPANNEYLSCQGSIYSEISSQQSDLVSINNATSDQLETLTGVGPATAKLIIQNRPYTKLEDLLNVKGIGDATFEKLKNQITL